MPATKPKKTHVLHFHDCPKCGEGNAYYDRPGPMRCDHCRTKVKMSFASEPLVDPSLD